MSSASLSVRGFLGFVAIWATISVLEASDFQEIKNREGTVIPARPTAYDLATKTVALELTTGSVSKVPILDLHVKSRADVFTSPQVVESLRGQGWKIPQPVFRRLLAIGAGAIVMSIGIQFLGYWMAAGFVIQEKGFGRHLRGFLKLLGVTLVLGIIQGVVQSLLGYSDPVRELISQGQTITLEDFRVEGNPVVDIVFLVANFLLPMLVLVGHYDCLGFLKSLWALIVYWVISAIGLVLLWGAAYLGFAFWLGSMFQDPDGERFNEVILRPLGLL